MEALDTVGFHIDAIRERLKEISDDSEIQDLLIYDTMMGVRALLMDQEMTKRREIDEYYYQTICVPLCKDTYAKCCGPAANINKFVLRSVNPLPDYITHKTMRPILVTTIDGEEGIDYQKTVTLKWDKYWEDLVYTKPTYDITNFNDVRTLVVHDQSLTLPEVLITAAFVDPVGAALSQPCNEDDNPCLDWKDVKWPIPSKLRRTMWQLTVQDLTGTKQEATDVTENAQSTKQEF